MILNKFLKTIDSSSIKTFSYNKKCTVIEITTDIQA